MIDERYPYEKYLELRSKGANVPDEYRDWVELCIQRVKQSKINNP